MDSTNLYLSGRCPYCHTALDYLPGDEAVHCHACDHVVATSLLLLECTGAQEEILEEDRFAMENVTTVSAGLVYFNHFCENFDWEAFATSSSLTLPRFNAISESYKLKFATNPLTYVLDFRRIVVPVAKKIEALKKIESELISRHASDISVLYSYFDKYSCLAESIGEEKETMKRTLLQDIELAEKYGADAEIVENLKKSFSEFVAALDTIKPADDLKQSGVFTRYKNEKDAVLARELAEAGIDALATYSKASSLLDSGDTENALHLLLSIRGYMDSAAIIEKHSKIFTYNGELIELGGQVFYLRDGMNTYFDVNDPTGYKKCPCKNLYEIVDGVPASRPTVTGITRILGAFGTRIYFIKNDTNICVYNTKKSDVFIPEQVLYTAPVGDFAIDDAYNTVKYTEDGSRFFIRKKLRSPEEKRGCALFRKKKKTPRVDRRNNYTIVLVDMDNVTVKEILPEVIDVMDYYGDSIFYTYLSPETALPSFHVYNITTESDEAILDSDCIIHAMIGTKIVYSVYAPNAYNLDLSVIDIKTKEPKLIAANVCGYYQNSGDKIFYTVGSADLAHLYSYDLESGESAEMLSSIGEIVSLGEEYLYYMKGNDRNAVLMRVSTDGKETLCIASRVSRIVRMGAGVIYYVNSRDELHMVRTDGRNDHTIAREVSRDDIIIDDKNIYYLRREMVGDVSVEGDGMSCSLYTTTLKGTDLKKIAFNVVSIKEFDEKTIYLCTKENASFTISRPVDKDNFEVDECTSLLTAYKKLDKTSGKITDVLTIGVPTAESREFRVGCALFKKTKTVNGAVIKNIRRDTYVRAGVARVGAVYDEELAAAQQQETR
ncbi:MAG: DUF5050 domain-containing protein [Clostridia bacterium]|nr:DUF5050 domain-containing protein [Clostridia bacterium]